MKRPEVCAVTLPPLPARLLAPLQDVNFSKPCIFILHCGCEFLERDVLAELKGDDEGKQGDWMRHSLVWRGSGPQDSISTRSSWVDFTNGTITLTVLKPLGFFYVDLLTLCIGVAHIDYRDWKLEAVGG